MSTGPASDECGGSDFVPAQKLNRCKQQEKTGRNHMQQRQHARVTERVREWAGSDVSRRRTESVAAGFSLPVGGLKAAATPFAARCPQDRRLISNCVFGLAILGSRAI